MKTLEQWLIYIDSIHSKKIDLSLDRVRKVAENLKLLPYPIKSVVVAGTNGKGTTSSLIAKIMANAGFKVGSTLSPHLLKFNERIKINLQDVSDEQIIQAFEAIEAARNNITLSYFEFNTLASLLIFLQQKVDLAVFEVGLGGRFDAVNIVDAQIAVITNIALDHTDYLGPTRESIGEAKAGIIRENRPIVFGEAHMPNSVLTEVTLKKAILYKATKDFYFDHDIDAHFFTTANRFKNLKISVGSVIPHNIATALQVIDLLNDQYQLNNADIVRSIETFNLAGRRELLAAKPTVLCDVAHNPHSVQALHDYVTGLKSAGGKIYAIFSMLRTKDLISSIRIIAPLIEHWHVAPLQSDISCEAQDFEAAFKGLSIKNYTIYNAISSAFTEVKNLASSEDKILVFGSFLTVSAVKNHLNQEA